MALSRRTYSSAALAATAVAVYGSLVPLRFTPIALIEAIDRFREVPYLHISAGGRADWVSNILLFVPLGYLWLGALALDVRRWRPLTVGALLVGTLLAAFSIALEFLQLWFPPRTVSQNDIIAETIGGFVGVALWVATGQATAEWLRGVARHRQPRDRFTRLLEIYAVAAVIYALLPFDLTLSSGELADKLRSGRLVLVPFSDIRLDWEGAYGLARDVAVFVPIGMLLAVWETAAGTRVRPVWMTTIAGAAVAAALELAQVFVLTRYASTTDVVFEAVGAMFGGWLMVWLYAGRYGSEAVSPVTSGTRKTLAWLGAALVCAAIAAVVFLAPFEVSGTSDQWGARYRGIWVPPFTRLYYNTEFNAVSDVARKLLLWGLLGAFGARAALSARLPPPVEWLAIAAVVIATAALSLAIELAQVMMPARVPDITDVLLAGLGATLGALVARKL